MRLVSQDNLVDIPYEQIFLALRLYKATNRYEILAKSLVDGSTLARMGIYSSIEKCTEIMNTLAVYYTDGFCTVFVFPKDSKPEETTDES